PGFVHVIHTDRPPSSVVVPACVATGWQHAFVVQHPPVADEPRTVPVDQLRESAGDVVDLDRVDVLNQRRVGYKHQSQEESGHLPRTSRMSSSSRVMRPSCRSSTTMCSSARESSLSILAAKRVMASY